MCKNLLLHIQVRGEGKAHVHSKSDDDLYVRQVNLATYRRLSSIATGWLGIPSIGYTSPSDDVTRKRDLRMAWNTLRGDRITDTRYDSSDMSSSQYTHGDEFTRSAMMEDMGVTKTYMCISEHTA